MAALPDEDAPLHHLGIQHGAHLIVLRPFIMINILNIDGKYLYSRVPIETTLQELKYMLVHKRVYTQYSYYDATMFMKTGSDTYEELEPTENHVIAEYLSDDDTLYLTSDTLFPKSYTLYYNGTEVGKVGAAYEESVLNLRLRTQAQTGLPVSNIRVTRSPPKFENSRHHNTETNAARPLGGRSNTNRLPTRIIRGTPLMDNERLFSTTCYVEIL